MKRRLGERVVHIFIYMVLILLTVCTIVPFMQVITISMNTGHVANAYGLHLLPVKLDFSGYQKVIEHRVFFKSYGNSGIVAALSVVISDTLIVLGAYPLSKRRLPHRKFWTMLVIFTMFFSGGMIPRYLVVKELGMIDSVWALVLPTAVNAYHLIIVRNFFETIPNEFLEAAKIDGAGELAVLTRVILPLSKAILATVSLWVFVAAWNDWFHCSLFIREEDKFVLQYVLYKILENGIDYTSSADVGGINPDSMKMAALVLSILPLVCVYPFLQRYYTKGVMYGAVKR